MSYLPSSAAPQATTLREAITKFEETERILRVAERTKQIQARVDVDEATKKAELDDVKNAVPPVVASQEKYIKLMGMLPGISKMDQGTLVTLKACEHLALSTNQIERIGPGLKELKNLRTFSIGRNQLKRFELLDLPLLENLWASYNRIDKLTGLDRLKSLKVLFMSNNLISSWVEIDRLAASCPELKDVLFINNPIQTNAASNTEYRLMMLQRLPRLEKLDGVYVTPEEREEAEARSRSS